jgi:hypothetical protein
MVVHTDAAVEWIIFYGDGTTFTNQDGEPWEAPRQNVQVVVRRDETEGRRLGYDRDYYCWHEGEQQWIPHDEHGLIYYLNTEPYCIRLCGYWISDREFQTILAQANTDNRLPPRVTKV